jgi:hypothetical protein
MNVLSSSSGLDWSIPMAVLRTLIMACGKFHLKGRLIILILFRLHHMLQFVEGPARWDPVCYKTGSLPHVDVLLSVTKAERTYFCGNERTAFDYNPNGKNLSQGTGYQISSADKFHYLVDIMNMHMEDKLVYLTMTYDILENQLPPGWNDTKVFYLDAASCLTSEIWPRKQTGSFTIESPTWKPNFEGKLLGSVGHLHDGKLL